MAWMSPGLKSSIDKIKSFTKEGQPGSEDAAKATTKHTEAPAPAACACVMMRAGRRPYSAAAAGGAKMTPDQIGEAQRMARW